MKKKVSLGVIALGAVITGIGFIIVKNNNNGKYILL